MEPGLGNHLLSPERAEVSRLVRPGRRHVRPGRRHRPPGRPSWTRCAWTPLSSRTLPCPHLHGSPAPEEPAPRCGLAACTRTSGAPQEWGPGPPPPSCGPQNLPVWPSGPVRAIPPATVLRRPSGAGFLGRFSRPSAAPSTVQGTLRSRWGAKAESAGGWGLRSVLPAFGVLSVFSTSLP